MNIKHYLLITLSVFMFSACNANEQTEENKAVENQAEQTTEATTETPEQATQAVHPGMAVHDENCAACHIIPHDEAFYTREDRKMESYEKLQSMVRMCDANLGTQLFDEDMEQIGDYLNEAFYKFPK
jgi:mono/diheme cytochrome c family protein